MAQHGYFASAVVNFFNNQANWILQQPSWPLSLNYCIDVDEITLTNNDFLSYDPNTAKWKNKSLTNLGTSYYNNADGGYYYETYTGIQGKVDGGGV